MNVFMKNIVLPRRIMKITEKVKKGLLLTTIVQGSGLPLLKNCLQMKKQRNLNYTTVKLFKANLFYLDLLDCKNRFFFI